METINGTKNPLLKTIKENDIVLIEIASMERTAFKQICRLYNLNYQPCDEQYNFDWLDFDAEVLYTNFRMHKSMPGCIGNCLSIIEIFQKEYVEQYARQYDMWNPFQYILSDAELELRQRSIYRDL